MAVAFPGIMHGAFRTHVGVVPDMIALDYFMWDGNNTQTTLRPRHTNRQTKTERLHHRRQFRALGPTSRRDRLTGLLPL